MYYNVKKQRLKDIIYITLILLVAVFSTHHIYYKFKEEHNIDYNSESLDVIFHENTGPKVTLSRVTPVTDSVGLSSKAYTFTIKNNLTEKVSYQIKLLDDLKTTEEDECKDYQIPKEYIKVSLKEDKEDNIIYDLATLEDNVLYSTDIKALAEKTYYIRLWTAQDSVIPTGSLLHYHGLINVIENNLSVEVGE